MKNHQPSVAVTIMSHHSINHRFQGQADRCSQLVHPEKSADLEATAVVNCSPSWCGWRCRHEMGIQWHDWGQVLEGQRCPGVHVTKFQGDLLIYFVHGDETSNGGHAWGSMMDHDEPWSLCHHEMFQWQSSWYMVGHRRSPLLCDKNVGKYL